MAEESPRKRLLDEATCSICLDLFTVPVTLDCGHNFCQACITQCWGKGPTDAACCPQCRARVQVKNLKPNRQLANFVEIAQQMSDEEKKEAEEGQLCKLHQEPLKLFCKDDQGLACVVCNTAKEHRGHNIVPVEEAAQECKDQISSCLESLKKERENVLVYKADTKKESQDLLKQTLAEKQKTLAQIRQLREFLNEKEEHLVAQLEEVETELAKTRDERMDKLSAELASLETLIQEMEELHKQPMSELLQDAGNALQRYEEKKFETSVAFPLALKWRVWEFRVINPILAGAVNQFKDSLVSGLQQHKAKYISSISEKKKLLFEEIMELMEQMDEESTSPEQLKLKERQLACLDKEYAAMKELKYEETLDQILEEQMQEMTERVLSFSKQAPEEWEKAVPLEAPTDVLE